MPLDAPPQVMGAPPPPSDLGQDPSAVGALSAMAGMGAAGDDIPGMLSMASEALLKVAQAASQQGNQALTMQIAQLMTQITDIGMAYQQGLGMPGLAASGMGPPPGPGPMAANMPQMPSPAGQMSPQVMLPRTGMQP